VRVQLAGKLSDAQKLRRLNIATDLRLRFNGHPELFDRVLTCDEKWVVYENPVRKRQWLDKDAIPTPTAKLSLHPPKRLLLVFWGTEGILHWELMPAGRTINAMFYAQVLDRVAAAMKEEWPHRDPKKVLFIQDNARPHTAKVTKRKLLELEWEVLPHPPYSPDMSPSDFHLFLSMQNHLAGVKFNDEEELRNWIDKFFREKPSSFFVRGIMKLMHQWEGVIDFEGGYAVD